MIGVIVGYAYWFNDAMFGAAAGRAAREGGQSGTSIALDSAVRSVVVPGRDQTTLDQITDNADRGGSGVAVAEFGFAGDGEQSVEVMPVVAPVAAAPVVHLAPDTDAAALGADAAAPGVDGAPVRSFEPLPPEDVEVLVLSYWPDDGDEWCAKWSNKFNRCVSWTTLGANWEALAGTGAACPDWWLGYTVVLETGDRFKCVDTGQVAGWLGAATYSIAVLSPDGFEPFASSGVLYAPG